MAWRRAVLVGLGALGLGCAGAPPRPAEKAPAPPPVAAEVAAAGAEAAPEKEPGDLAIWLRLSAPGVDLPWFGALLPPGNPASVALRHPGAMLNVMVGEGLASAIDLEQPLDFVAPADEADGEARFAVAVGLRPGTDPAALGEAYKVTARPGGVAIEAAQRGSAGFLAAPGACEIRPGARGVARLVCASEPRLLDAYAPFLARGTPPPEPGVAVSLRVRSEGLRAARLAAGKPDGDDDPGARLASRWIDEYLRELGGLNAELRLRGGDLELAVEQTILRARTVTSVAECARPGAPGALPEAFWRVPADADAAFSFQGAPPEVMRPLAGPALVEFIDALPDLTAAERAEALTAMRGIFLTGGPGILAYGHPRASAERALEKLAAAPAKGAGKPDPGAEKALLAAHAAVTGWTMLHVDEPVARWREGLTALALAGQGARAGGPALPGAAPAPAAPVRTEESRTHDTWRVVPVTARERLPAGSFHLVNVVRPNPRYTPKDKDHGRAAPHDVHFLGAPDGAGTWLVVAEDEALARAQLAQALSGPPARALAGRPELAPLRGQEGAGAGFVSIAGMVSLALPDDSAEEMLEARAPLAAAAVLPHRGAAPIPITWTSAAIGAAEAGARGCRVRAAVTLGPSAIGDALAWFVARMPAPHP